MFEKIIGHEESKEILKNDIVNGKVSHALYAINTTGNVVVNNGTILNNNGYAVRVLAKMRATLL